jgi:hypothetical protein
MLSSCSLSQRQIIRTCQVQHSPTQPTRTESTSSKTLTSIVLLCYITHPPIHLSSLHFIKYKQTYTHLLVSHPKPPFTHTPYLPKHTAFQVKPKPNLPQITMAASDFTNTGAPVNSFTEYRGYRDKMCVVQNRTGRGQLYMSSCTLQGRGQLYMSSCTLQHGRGQLYMSSCSLMRN